MQDMQGRIHYVLHASCILHLASCILHPFKPTTSTISEGPAVAMHHFTYRNARLHCEDLPIEELARQFATPLYLYSRRTLRESFLAIDGAFAGKPHEIYYAVKANTNAAILREFTSLGAGADVVSGGELAHARRAGVPAERIVFAGVGKRDDEILTALRENIRGLNVESEQELEVVGQLAAREGVVAPVSFRVNPNIDISGHPYISTGRSADKFGIESERIVAILDAHPTWRNKRLVGLHAHVGSNISELWPFEAVGRALAELARRIIGHGVELKYLDVGGGLGVRYEQALALQPDTSPVDDLALPPREVANSIWRGLGDLHIPLIFEPGRALVASSGALVARVLFVKETRGRKFVILDAAMNDLVRPSLYQAYHQIVPVHLQEGQLQTVDVVGPICESGDFLARDRELPPLRRGDLVAVMTTGAYGFALASNYNSRPRPAEVLIDGRQATVINPRQSIESIWQNG